jgi:transcriptional regulator with XRE-family HTH domain
MEKQEFSFFRKKLGKTQKQMAQLLGKSIKAIHSYEQGWRVIPMAAERQVYFLATLALVDLNKRSNCWNLLNCDLKKRSSCPAWEFKAGKYCWFINGTICKGTPRKNWREKIQICKSCKIFPVVIDGTNELS